MTTAIRNVRAEAYRVPLARPVQFSTRAVAAREYVVVWIETADGVAGTGHTYAGTSGGHLVRDIVRDLFAPLLLGADAEDIASIWTQLYQETLLLGRRGAVIRALSAVDIALHDRAAIAAGKPLYRYLGGSDPNVHAYASGGYYGGGASDGTSDPLRLIELEMRRNVERGLDAAKMKVGRDFALDVERVRVAREALGPARKLALDANNAWRTADDAIRFVRAVERYEPWWIEEPLSPDDPVGHGEVARALEVPVATGEINQTRWEFDALIRAGGADILQPDAAVLGGVSEWLAVARLAAVAHLPVAPHWYHPIHVHLAAATPHCLTVEHFSLDLDIYNFDALIKPDARLAPKGGRLTAPDRPGHGVDLDESALARYRV